LDRQGCGLDVCREEQYRLIDIFVANFPSLHVLWVAAHLVFGHRFMTWAEAGAFRSFGRVRLSVATSPELGYVSC
jgi:hypothetical protein